jgi:membrane protease subunit (stomatin/prohibitin family)
MGVIGNMGAYTQMQLADSLVAGAQNPSGGNNPAGAAMGMGMGFAMAGQMTQQMMNLQNQQFQGWQQQYPPAGAAPPPPITQPPVFHVSVNGMQQGPFPMAQLQQMAMQGQLTPATMVWTAGMATWAEAGTVSSLTSLFGSVPPPL